VPGWGASGGSLGCLGGLMRAEGADVVGRGGGADRVEDARCAHDRGAPGLRARGSATSRRCRST